MSKSGKIRAIPKLAETLSLTKDEATILLPLIRGGNLTAGAISMVVDQPLTSVSKPLKTLVTKGLVEEIDSVVPLYRATPPILPMIKVIEGFIDESEKIGGETTSTVQKLQKSTEKTLGTITKANESRYNKLNGAYDVYEKEVADIVQTHISAMTALTSGILNDYSQRTQTTLDSLNLSLEDQIGQKLTLLQDELDKSQKQLTADVKKLSKEFAKWLTQEKSASLSSIKEVDEKSNKLVAGAKKVLEAALKSSEKALQESTEQISSILGAKALESSNAVSEMLTNLSEALKLKTANFEFLFGQNLTASRKTLNETSQEAQQNAESQSENMQKRFDDILGLTTSFTENIDQWKEEVANYMETASQSVLAQLEQLNASEKAFLEIVRSSLSGHIDKMNASIGEEYKAVRNLARTLTADTDTLMSEARTSIIELLQNEVSGNKERLQLTNDNLQENIVSWGDKASKAIDKKVNSAVKEISTVLDTEAAELNSLADNITSRLKSSFSGVISTTETKNDAALSSIRRIASEYESSLESKLTDISSQHITAVQQQVNEAKTLYEGLNQRLNSRLAESMNTLGSQVTRAQKEIDVSITEQVARIDRHAEEMRNDFHTRIEEMTQQFISVTQSMESSFNGLIASQSVEARDLIASAHTEFKTVVKSEMDSLDSDSIKLQQEFASEIGMRIDSVVESTAALKRSLNEFTADKKTEISKSMEDAISSIEASLASAQESLLEIETGTVKQFADNVQQLSREFGVSVAGARDNVTERLKSITIETADILAKNT
ncbi:MAG: helix-turn-helix domain-containing protein, partial [Candidatus Thorarchaeota archaeon]